MKTFEVIVDIDAEDDLFDIYRYVAFSDSIAAADKLIGHLKRACFSLQRLPNRGHIPPELQDIGVSQFREIRFKPYRVFYSIEDRRVIIHCVLDGRRDVQTLLEERLLR
jgi:toxin ParE1/3/4